MPPDALLTAAQAAGNDRQGHDAFYALLYVGLWHEAHGDAEAAQAAITQVSRPGSCLCLLLAPCYCLASMPVVPTALGFRCCCNLPGLHAYPPLPLLDPVPDAGSAHSVCQAVGRLHGSAGWGALPAPRLAGLSSSAAAAHTSAALPALLLHRLALI